MASVYRLRNKWWAQRWFYLFQSNSWPPKASWENLSPSSGNRTGEPTSGLGCSVPLASGSKSFQILCPCLLLPFQRCGLSTDTEFISKLHLRNGFHRIKNSFIASQNWNNEHFKVIHSLLCKSLLCMFDREARASSSIFDLDLPFLFRTPSYHRAVNFYNSRSLPLSWYKNSALLVGKRWH